ncbi:hypothetical protein MPDQ_000535 [Monascus purpureus]|uniref:Uncharacterized protein n=1 Tax=Monascus purpureus TaxID=5098 RepID=A0A507R3F1_MONPU|nr:hypothetical protein MPDQ_000535 [Monascus purpureus]
MLRRDPSTGRHADDALNAAAARSAGFPSTAVDLIYPVNYLGDDEGNFEAWREVFLLRNQPLLPSMVALVCNADSGVMLLYDVEAKMTRAWRPDGKEEDPLLLSARLPSDIPGPYIEKYKTIFYLITPSGLDDNPEIYAKQSG